MERDAKQRRRKGVPGSAYRASEPCCKPTTVATFRNQELVSVEARHSCGEFSDQLDIKDYWKKPIGPIAIGRLDRD